MNCTDAVGRETECNGLPTNECFGNYCDQGDGIGFGPYFCGAMAEDCLSTNCPNLQEQLCPESMPDGNCTEERECITTFFYCLESKVNGGTLQVYACGEENVPTSNAVAMMSVPMMIGAALVAAAFV